MFLYNACNGMMQEGLLDIRKLDELSPEELEVFDVAQLRAAWRHIAAGCAQCEGIIQTLNIAREMLRADVDKPSKEPGLAMRSLRATTRHT